MCPCSPRQNPGSNEIVRPSRWARIIAAAERQSQAAPPPPRPFIGVPLPGRELVGESVAQCIRSPRRRGRAAKVEMKRREFITLIGGAAAAWPLAAGAQQGDRVRRIGVLMAFAESDREAQSWVAAFREELSKLGWTGGRNIEIDTRWATADVESMQRFAKELVALQPDLILTSSTPATAAMLQQTRAIPIIFVWVADPVGSGFVASLPRPGGNVTGFTPIEGSLGGKWVELLKEIAPRVARVILVFNPAMATF